MERPGRCWGRLFKCCTELIEEYTRWSSEKCRLIVCLGSLCNGLLCPFTSDTFSLKLRFVDLSPSLFLCRWSPCPRVLLELILASLALNISRSPRTRSSSLRIWLYPARCFSMSFHSWAFCAERTLRSFTACSSAAPFGSGAPALALSKNAVVRGRSLLAADREFDEADAAEVENEADVAVEAASGR